MICVRCEEREAKYIKRGLCKKCYSLTYRLNKLSLYPNNNNRWAVNKYSPELLAAMNELIERNDCTLREIAERFGCSRENIRQIFEKVYGFHYTVIKNKRVHLLQEKKETEIQLKKDPRGKVLRYKKGNYNTIRGADGEKKVFEICAALGYEIKPYLSSREIDLVINSKNIEVKSAFSYWKIDGAKTRRFHFSFHKNQRAVTDFVVCWAAPMNAFFVIPKSSYPKGNSIYIPEKPVMEWTSHQGAKQRRINKWYDYLEAWHLLKTEPNEIVFNHLSAAQTAPNSCTRAVNAQAEDRAEMEVSTM